ncbi:Zinc finger CCCH domain-containing protein 10-like [Oopsacas minuta]|uniref:Zinc finger CCCH domain-containing protein 10-like n=1 Tax=Oopsacas minuta TaxID=111878 RepID=A0AAV7JKZ2_9METZ|nr:Zinc finger CCCH domain-containing protein 10-like [Oopsacas minuta]
MQKQFQTPYYYDQRMKNVGEHAPQQYMDMFAADPQQQQMQDMKQEYCRDFQRGKCMRGQKCKYRHAENLDIAQRDKATNIITFCRNFQRGKCNLPNCKYLHFSRADEEFYFQTGTLPNSNEGNYNPFAHQFTGQIPVSNPTEQTPALSSLSKPFSNTTTLPVGTAIHAQLSDLSAIPVSTEQPLPEYFKHSPPKSDSPFSPELSDFKIRSPPQKSLSHSTQSISDYLGAKSDGVTRSRRWSIDNTDATEEGPHKLSPLSLTSRDEAFKNPEVDLLKIKLHQCEEKVKSLEFYNDILREQNLQLKQQVKRYENPFSPIYKPIIQDDNEAQSI